MQLEFTYRLPRPLALLGALPPLMLAAAMLWRLTQTGGAAGDELRGLCAFALMAALAATTRSEERRVGKECRSRWSPYH